jgi:hypothetical protein
VFKNEFNSTMSSRICRDAGMVQAMVRTFSEELTKVTASSGLSDASGRGEAMVSGFCTFTKSTICCCVGKCAIKSSTQSCCRGSGTMPAIRSMVKMPEVGWNPAPVETRVVFRDRRFAASAPSMFRTADPFFIVNQPGHLFILFERVEEGRRLRVVPDPVRQFHVQCVVLPLQVLNGGFGCSGGYPCT